MMRRRVGLVLLVVGVLASIPSLFNTFSHVGDPAYRLTDFMSKEAADPTRAEGHASYHAFREFLLAATALAVILGIAFSLRLAHDPRSWWLALVLGVGYTLGWWLPWPLFGLRAPHALAELVHASATIFILTGLVLTRPAIHGRSARRD